MNKFQGKYVHLYPTSLFFCFCWNKNLSICLLKFFSKSVFVSIWWRHVTVLPLQDFYEAQMKIQFNSVISVQFSHSVVSESLRPHELQHTRPPCPSPTSRVYPNSCPLSRWCHPAISSSVVPFSSCPQVLPASESFPMSQLFAWGGQSIGVSASTSVFPVNIQDWFPLGWTG